MSAYRNLTALAKVIGLLLSLFARECVSQLEKEGRYSTAHLYRNSLRSYTVSTYLRMLRSLYNQGADLGLAPHVYRLFHDVYTGIDTRHKKALGRDELFRLLYKDPGTETLRRTQQTARLLYQLCGMPFVDLSHLRSSDISEGVLEYRRIKTGSKISESLGHRSIRTTQIYLAGFEASELAEVNRKACLYAVKRERKESVTSQVTERDP